MLLFNLLTIVVPESLTIFNVYCAMTIVFIVMAVFIAGVFFALSRITLSVTHAAIDEEGNKGLAFSLKIFGFNHIYFLRADDADE